MVLDLFKLGRGNEWEGGLFFHRALSYKPWVMLLSETSQLNYSDHERFGPGRSNLVRSIFCNVITCHPPHLQVHGLLPQLDVITPCDCATLLSRVSIVPLYSFNKQYCQKQKMSTCKEKGYNKEKILACKAKKAFVSLPVTFGIK